MEEYKVLITTSGIGSRLGNFTDFTANAGALMQIKQTWLVVLACRVGRKEQAGELMIDVIKSLAGKAINGMGPWLRVNSPVKPKFTKGYAYYPLAFTCQMRLRGN